MSHQTIYPHEKRPCQRCGRTISERADGSGLRAHKCSHGVECQPPRDSPRHNLECATCKRLRDESSKLCHVVDPESVIIELGFTIEDPCPASALELARALVAFGRSVPEDQRSKAIEILGLLREIGCVVTAERAGHVVLQFSAKEPANENQ